MADMYTPQPAERVQFLQQKMMSGVQLNKHLATELAAEWNVHPDTVRHDIAEARRRFESTDDLEEKRTEWIAKIEGWQELARETGDLKAGIAATELEGKGRGFLRRFPRAKDPGYKTPQEMREDAIKLVHEAAMENGPDRIIAAEKVILLTGGYNLSGTDLSDAEQRQQVIGMLSRPNPPWLEVLREVFDRASPELVELMRKVTKEKEDEQGREDT